MRKGNDEERVLFGESEYGSVCGCREGCREEWVGEGRVGSVIGILDLGDGVSVMWGKVNKREIDNGW